MGNQEIVWCSSSTLLTINRIGFENPTNRNEIRLLKYNNDLSTMDVLQVKEMPPNATSVPITKYNDKFGMTYTEKVLRQILIPKDEPHNLNMFKDFLERLGSCITGENPFKVITMYYNENGNNGKGILKLLFELVFNKQSYPLTPNDMDGNFNLPAYMDRRVILIDEIDRNSFNKLKPDLKRMSSKYARTEQRMMYTDKNAIINNYANIFIFSNVLISMTLDELALFDRMDFLELPNRFVYEHELNKYPNTYLKDPLTEEKILSDYDGLSWLITASILAYKSLKATPNATYTLRQTIEESMDIFLDTDHLTKFIKIYTEKDEELIPDDFITTSEIASQ